MYKNENEIVNFIMDKFPKPQRWKEYPQEETPRLEDAWESFSQTGLGCECWACNAIMNKAYFNRPPGGYYEKQANISNVVHMVHAIVLLVNTTDLWCCKTEAWKSIIVWEICTLAFLHNSLSCWMNLKWLERWKGVISD